MYYITPWQDSASGAGSSGGRLDRLGHPGRAERIHILSVDPVLALDVYERIGDDPRMKGYERVRPREREIRKAAAEIDALTAETVRSRVLIIDVRKETLALLQQAYNKVVGYNRRDLNKVCHIVLIGDGPRALFGEGQSLGVFVGHLAELRVDYQPAAFFYDPFIHYEPEERGPGGMGEEIVLPERLPRRFEGYFMEGRRPGIEEIREYFRAEGRPAEVKQERQKRLWGLFKKRIAEQFPEQKEEMAALFTKEGLRLQTERLHMYPLYFEDWVYELMQKRGERGT